MQSTVLVIGASGTVGRHLSRRLLKMGVPVRGATRTPRRAVHRKLPATEWVRFDLEDPDTFAPALRGVRRLFLLARPGDPDPAGVAAPLIEAMKVAEVRRIVNLTAMGAESRGDVPLGEVERLVEEAGFAWTHLRPNWFMQVFTSGPLLEGIRSAARIAVPAGGSRISFVDARDVAAVAAEALVHPGHVGRAYTLTGNRAMSHEEVARVISRATGRPIEYADLSEDRARAAILSSGLGPDRADRLIRFYRLVREGHAKPVTPDIPSVLRRPPISFARFARDYRETWGRPPESPKEKARSYPPKEEM